MFADERFHLSYIIDPVTRCWNWAKSLSEAGYGRFSLCHEKDIPAHRFSYELHFGLIPFGLLVCHHCDNPPCVNPAHLFVGTQADNMQDMIAKGRQVKHRKGPSGEKSRTAKLTSHAVLIIRADDRPASELSDIFRVSVRAIQMVKSRETWNHL